MDNQHQQIQGYRDLDQAEIDLVNRIKSAESDLAQLWQEIVDRPGTDKRWAALARTDVERGMMALVRSVARPDSPWNRAEGA